MFLAGRRGFGRAWEEFQSTFSEFAGLSIQLFDASGAACGPSSPAPLCAFLERCPETRIACQRDCYRRPAACRESRRILAARCHAGLSYRLVPVLRRGRPEAILLVGRVLTEVFGAEQRLDFLRRFRLDRQSFSDVLASVRTLAGSDLDRAAAFIQRMAHAFSVSDRRLRARERTLERKRELAAFARQTVAGGAERDPGGLRVLLERLARVFGAPGAALLVPEGLPARHRVLASIGIGEDALHALAARDWEGMLRGRDAGQLFLADRPEMLRRGIDVPWASLAAQRLGAAEGGGYLLLAGAALRPRDLDHLEAAGELLAARVAHHACRETAALREQEVGLLALMAERYLAATSLEEILPLALEAALRGLGARRGSILLVEREGRITAHALRGDHAPLAGTIESLLPDSVSHRVFFEGRPLLVRDVECEPGLKRERQFPYATRSFVSVPLRGNGHALGVLHVTEREGEEGVFTHRDLALLERLGLQAAGAIRKATLEEEVRALRMNTRIDHLTGAHNRRSLDERLAAEIRRAGRYGHPLAVVMLDLDNFKAFNDELGHVQGDRLLREVAEAIRGQLRSIDLVARYGGDEFALVLPETSAEGARPLVARIRARIASLAPSDAAAGSRRLTASAGFAVFPDTAPEELINRADQALLEAKRAAHAGS